MNCCVLSGSGVVGSSQNEEIAVGKMMDELKKLQKEINPAFDFEIDFQTATGTFEVNYRGFHPITNSYIRVHNIVARVSRKGASKESALMLATPDLDDFSSLS